MIFLTSLLSAAFAAPLPSGWHELQDFPVEPPANSGSVKKAFPLATSSAPYAWEKVVPKANRKNIRYLSHFISVSFHIKNVLLSFSAKAFARGDPEIIPWELEKNMR